MASPAAADTSVVLAELAADTRYEDLPAAVVSHAKYLLLDAVSVALAGATAPGVPEIRDLVLEWSGTRESRLLVSGERVPSPNAAMVNATMLQARDYDDTHARAALHSLCTVLPAALAESERLGGIDGRALLTAIVLGVEISCRVGAAVLKPLSFSRTATLGCLAAAGAAARLAGLDAAGIHRAIGIAYSQAAGNMQVILDRGLSKRMQPGFAARAGITAARLAEKGIDGARAVLEGRYGYLNLYEGGDYSAADLREGLGSRWAILDVAVKPFPAALDSQGAIEAALALRQSGVGPAAIESVEVFASHFVHVAGGTPIDEQRGHPIAEAILSVPYAVAVALIDGEVRLHHFTEKHVSRADLRDLARRVRVIWDRGIPDHAFAPVRVAVRLRSGGRVSREVQTLRGGREMPLSDAEQIAKLQDCVRSLDESPDVGWIERLRRTALSIEDLDDVTRLLDVLTIVRRS